MTKPATTYHAARPKRHAIKIKWPTGYEWLHEYLLKRPGAVLEHKESWNAMLYRLHDKIFAMLLRDNNNRTLVNLKCDPMIAIEFREEFKGVEAGWHMNKIHWVSLNLAVKTPQSAVTELVDIS
ncbi:MmcQ/YjbR family DNA-binding protein, partial [Desulfovibrio sp. OttesenSCG-928-F07]|nr:MmcQ/YjbR family DNA-binding protein [Desulfovibrio sp. OttesenSCG-928-F07]